MALEQIAVEELVEQSSNASSVVADGLQEGLQPILGIIQPFISQIVWVLGGIAGIYLIMVIARVHYERKKVRLLTKMLYDLDHLNMHHGIKCSRDKKGLIRRIIHKIAGLFRKKAKGDSFQKK